MLTPPHGVFLSYARKDGETFATALRERLAAEEPEITVWQDRGQLEGGLGWWAQIEEALDQTKFLVIVMTPHALASENTAREWRCARQRGVIVYPVKGVPDNQIDFAPVPRWIRKAHFFDLGQFVNGRWQGEKEWKTFVNFLKSDRQPVRVPFMAPDLPPGFVPRSREFDELLQQVLGPARDQPLGTTVALQGAGGYGKTTLASAICHDERVFEAFDDGVLWTSLGQTPSLVDKLAEVHAALTGRQHSFVDVPYAAAALAERLESRNCLLVIDDVWSRVHLEPFLKGARQCVRLVTTRRFDLVNDVTRIQVDKMSAAESARVLAMVLPSGAVADDRLSLLARRLGDWPLLLKLTSGMIRSRLARGDSPAGALTYIERALDKRGVTAFDQRESAQRDEAVRKTVAVSLDLLSAQDAPRFLELAIFPEEVAVPVATLERLWGLDDLDTVDCAQRLDDVSLLKLDLQRGVVTLHDVMRTYLLHELPDAAFVHGRLVDAYGHLEPPDSYAWRWLPYHLRHAGRAEALRALLLRPEWLHGKLRAVGPHALIADVDLVRGDSELTLVQSTLRLALPALVADPDQLWEQLLGRLPLGFSSRLESFRSTLTAVAPKRRLRARWPNLRGAGGGLIQTLSGHQGDINDVLLLQDGRVLSWSDDRTLRAWDLSTGESRVFAGHEASIVGALELPDRRALSWDSDGVLRVWELVTGETHLVAHHEGVALGALVLDATHVLSWDARGELRISDLAATESRALTGHEESVWGALPLPHGRALSWSSDATLRIWDLGTGNSRVLTGHKKGVDGALQLHDGRVVSWSIDGTLRVWNVTTGESRPLVGHANAIFGAVLSAEGNPLSWAGDGTLRLWDLTSEDARTLVGHTSTIGGALPMSDGRALSWSEDGTLRVWDLATGEGRALMGHRGGVRGAILLPGGRALSWGADGTLRVWEIATGEGRALTGHESEVTRALLLPDGNVLSMSRDRTLRVWSLATEHRPELIGHDAAVGGARLLSDGRALSWGDDGTLRMWNVMTGEGRRLEGHIGRIGGVLPLPDGRMLSWGDDGDLRTWNLATGESRALSGGRVLGVTMLPDGRALSWSAGSSLRVWDLVTGEGYALAGREGWVWIHGALALSGGRVLSWSSGPSLWVRDLDTEKRSQLAGHERAVNGVLLLPGERPLSWSDDRTLRVWDLETLAGRPLTGHEEAVLGARLLPDERVLSWSGDRIFRVWEIPTGEGRTLGAHEEWINGVLLLPGGRVLSWSKDRTLRVWDVMRGDVRVLTGHDGSVMGARLLPDGRVVSWSDDRCLRIRHIDGDDRGLAFYFDATPVFAIPGGAGAIWVGDALGGIHVLDV